jgi:hypothetical protein
MPKDSRFSDHRTRLQQMQMQVREAHTASVADPHKAAHMLEKNGEHLAHLVKRARKLNRAGGLRGMAFGGAVAALEERALPTTHGDKGWSI